MDIHAKSVDMDMDGKFHIHGNPAELVPTWRDRKLASGMRYAYCTHVMGKITYAYCENAITFCRISDISCA